MLFTAIFCCVNYTEIEKICIKPYNYTISALFDTFGLFSYNVHSSNIPQEKLWNIQVPKTSSCIRVIKMESSHI